MKLTPQYNQVQIKCTDQVRIIEIFTWMLNKYFAFHKYDAFVLPVTVLLVTYLLCCSLVSLQKYFFCQTSLSLTLSSHQVWAHITNMTIFRSEKNNNNKKKIQDLSNPFHANTSHWRSFRNSWWIIVILKIHWDDWDTLQISTVISELA